MYDASVCVCARVYACVQYVLYMFVHAYLSLCVCVVIWNRNYGWPSTGAAVPGWDMLVHFRAPRERLRVSYNSNNTHELTKHL